jgi:hypothetical protein
MVGASTLFLLLHTVTGVLVGGVGVGADDRRAVDLARRPRRGRRGRSPAAAGARPAAPALARGAPPWPRRRPPGGATGRASALMLLAWACYGTATWLLLRPLGRLGVAAAPAGRGRLRAGLGRRLPRRRGPGRRRRAGGRARRRARAARRGVGRCRSRWCPGSRSPWPTWGSRPPRQGCCARGSSPTPRIRATRRTRRAQALTRCAQPDQTGSSPAASASCSVGAPASFADSRGLSGRESRPSPGHRMPSAGSSGCTSCSRSGAYGVEHR